MLYKGTHYLKKLYLKRVYKKQMKIQQQKEKKIRNAVRFLNKNTLIQFLKRGNDQIKQDQYKIILALLALWVIKSNSVIIILQFISLQVQLLVRLAYFYVCKRNRNQFDCSNCGMIRKQIKYHNDLLSLQREHVRKRIQRRLQGYGNQSFENQIESLVNDCVANRLKLLNMQKKSNQYSLKLGEQMNEIKKRIKMEKNMINQNIKYFEMINKILFLFFLTHQFFIKNVQLSYFQLILVAKQLVFDLYI